MYFSTAVSLCASIPSLQLNKKIQSGETVKQIMIINFTHRDLQSVQRLATSIFTTQVIFMVVAVIPSSCQFPVTNVIFSTALFLEGKRSFLHVRTSEC